MYSQSGAVCCHRCRLKLRVQQAKKLVICLAVRDARPGDTKWPTIHLPAFRALRGGTTLQTGRTARTVRRAGM